MKIKFRLKRGNIWKIFILLSLDQFWNIHLRYGIGIAAGIIILIDYNTTIRSGSYCYRANMLHKFGFNIKGDVLRKLNTRREVNKICMFYKLNVGSFLEFLCDLIPLSVGETNYYNLRNRHNISQTTNRLSISQQ